MPAPDYATLYNVEDAIESAVKALFTAATLTPCFIQRESVNLPASRIQIQCLVSANFEHRQNAWSGALLIGNMTDRSKDAATVHGWRRGQIRNILCRVPIGDDYHPDFSPDVLPYHVINLLEISGTEPQVNVDEDADFSVLSFALVISIRPGAFPV